MKYKLLFLLVLLGLTSCEKMDYKNSNTIGVVVEKDSIPAQDKYEYYYGYSMMEGKFCYHYGMNHYDARYTTTINVDTTTYISGYRNNYKIGDTIQMVKTLTIRDKDKKIVDVRYSEKN